MWKKSYGPQHSQRCPWKVFQCHPETGRGEGWKNLLFSAVQIARFLTAEKTLQCQCLNANYLIFILLDSAFTRSTNNLIETILILQITPNSQQCRREKERSPTDDVIRCDAMWCDVMRCDEIINVSDWVRNEFVWSFSLSGRQRGGRAAVPVVVKCSIDPRCSCSSHCTALQASRHPPRPLPTSRSLGSNKS